jgi:superfamily II DNA/RNA helicase
MKDPVTHSLAVTEQREADMDHHVLVVDSHVKDDVIAQIASREGRTIFFVRTKHGADRLTEKLKKQGVDAGVLHGGRTQKQRMRVLDAFKIGKKRALIATDVAARGIHVDDVSLVVHVDPPETHKDYLHRAGRTARAGAKGTVVSIASSGNRKRVHNLGKEAGVKMTETRIESRDNHLHPDLLRITGAQEPSGVPVADELVTRSERSKPGRKRFDDRNPRREREERPKRDRDERPRANRDERPRAAFEKKRTERKFDDRKPRRDDRPRRDIEGKKPDRDALRRKDRGSKKFDSRLEKRINIREEKPKREERREEKKTVTGPNRIQRRAHLQPADRPVKTRHEKRTKGSSKSKPKRSGKPATRKSGTSARKTTGNRKPKSRSRAGR